MITANLKGEFLTCPGRWAMSHVWTIFPTTWLQKENWSKWGCEWDKPFTHWLSTLLDSLTLESIGINNSNSSQMCHLNFFACVPLSSKIVKSLIVRTIFPTWKICNISIYLRHRNPTKYLILRRKVTVTDIYKWVYLYLLFLSIRNTIGDLTQCLCS